MTKRFDNKAKNSISKINPKTKKYSEKEENYQLN